MKEFALKHPILTFLLADTLIAGVCNVFGSIFGKSNETQESTVTISTTEEDDGK